MEKLFLILHSGDWDRLYHALSIATMAQALGSEVHIFLSYWALERLAKEDREGPEVVGEAHPRRELLERAVKEGHLLPLSRLLAQARAFGKVSVYACSASMALLNIGRDELPPHVDKSMGLAQFMQFMGTWEGCY